MATPLIYECRRGKRPRVTRVDISLLGPEEIRRMSVVKVTDGAVYDKNLPRVNGVNDHRMGPVDRRLECGTCGNPVERCNGHPGHVELEHPVYHIGYMETVLRILQSVCFFCCRLKLDEATAARARRVRDDPRCKARFSATVALAKSRRVCPHCGGAQPTYTRPKRDPLRIEADWRGAGQLSDPDERALAERRFGQRDALNILEHVLDEDYRVLGFEPTESHPSWMVLTVLVVPPPIIRPSITETEGSRTRGQDDLTHKLRNIVNANNEIAKWRKGRVGDAYNLLTALSLAVPGEDAGGSGPPDGATGATAIAARSEEDGAVAGNGGASPPPPAAPPLAAAAEGGERTADAGERAGAMVPIAGLDLDEMDVPEELVAALQLECATYINNEIRGLKPSVQRSGAPTKSVTSRFRGKEGRLRGNLMGKRVNYSARAVISPDPMIDVDQIGVPYEMALELTYPERVTPFNIEDLSRRVQNGPSRLPGARSVVDREGRVLYLDEMGAGWTRRPRAGCGGDGGGGIRIALQIGWIVNRHLKDGDVVVFNRQPSLHKGSMMGHRVKLMPGLTFRMNLSCTPTYNADFDGDEMNMHVVQSEGARAEVSEVMGVPMQIVSPQSSKPIIGLVQDALVGSMLLTGRDVFLERWQVCDLVMQMQYDAPGKASRFTLPPPAVVKPRPLWTGKQVYSALLPAALNLKRRVRDLDEWNPMDRDERAVLVRRGELVCGSLCKQTVGHAAGGVVHLMYKDVGPRATANFLSDAQRVVNQWLSWRGLSVGPDDCRAPPGLKATIDGALDSALDHMVAICRLARGGGRTARPGRSAVGPGNGGGGGGCVMDERELEGGLSKIANRALDQVGRMVHRAVTPQNNSVVTMTTAGSKGNPLNPTQMLGNVGQQSVEGARIRPESGGRLLPSGRHGEAAPRPSAYGYVRSSYERGLTPQEFFYHNMGGREGLVDTAVKTAESGYIQRRLIKSMESLQVRHGGLVRNSSGDVVQFCYGGDGIDATYIERVPLRHLTMSDAEVERDLAWSAADLARWCAQRRTERAAGVCNGGGGEHDDDVHVAEVRSVVAAEVARALTMRDAMREMKGIGAPSAASSSSGGRPQSDAAVAVHVPRLIERVWQRASAEYCPEGPLRPRELLLDVDAVCSELEQRGRVAGIAFHGTLAYRAVLCAELVSARIVGRMACTRSAWREIRNALLGLYDRFSVQTGEMVGALAAQSIGEPSTQMSVVYEERLVLSGPQGPFVTEIGAFVERQLNVPGDGDADADADAGGGDTAATSVPRSSSSTATATADISALGISVPAVDERGAVRWRRVTGVTRHPPNGPLVRVVTRGGRSVTATLAKSFLTLRGGRVVPIAGADLAVGDPVPVDLVCPPPPPPLRPFRVGEDSSALRSGWPTHDECGGFGVAFAARWRRRRRGRRGGYEGVAKGRDDAVARDERSLASLMGAPSGHALAFLRGCERVAGADGIRCPSALAVDQVAFLAARAGRRCAILPGGRVAIDPDRTRTEGSVVVDAVADPAAPGTVWWDEVATVQRVDSCDVRWVYDLSVEEDANFALANGLQMRDTLRTFYFAGCAAKNVTLGVPRLKEIVDATKAMKRPSATVYLTQPFRSSRAGAELVRRALEYVTLGTLVRSCEVVHERVPPCAAEDIPSFDRRSRSGSRGGAVAIPRGPADDARANAGTDGRDGDKEKEEEGKETGECGSRDKIEQEPQEEEDFAVAMSYLFDPDNARATADASRWTARFVLDREATDARGLDPSDIARCVERYLGDAGGLVCSTRRACASWVVRVRLRGIAPMLEKAAAQGQSPATVDELERQIVARAQATLLQRVVISGVPGISRAIPVEAVGPEWTLETEGTCLARLLALPHVDGHRTYSNHVHEVAAVLGIEAAATVLHSEIRNVISFDGTYVNPAHFSVMCDMMTHTGQVLAMSRHGINKLEAGYLVRASFEETVDVLFEAAAHAEKNEVADGAVTESIILGQTAPIGTGTIDVLLTPEYAERWTPPRAPSSGWPSSSSLSVRGAGARGCAGSGRVVRTSPACEPGPPTTATAAAGADAGGSGGAAEGDGGRREREAIARQCGWAYDPGPDGPLLAGVRMDDNADPEISPPVFAPISPRSDDDDGDDDAEPSSRRAWARAFSPSSPPDETPSVRDGAASRDCSPARDPTAASSVAIAAAATTGGWRPSSPRRFKPPAIAESTPAKACGTRPRPDAASVSAAHESIFLANGTLDPRVLQDLLDSVRLGGFGDGGARP